MDELLEPSVANDRLLPGFPDSARIWLRAPAKAPTAGQREAMLAGLAPTVRHWKSHGTVVPAAALFLDDALLLVAADFTGAEVSGCSIDRMVAALREAEQASGLELVDLIGVHARLHGELRYFTRDEFARALVAGEVDRDTPVYDLTLLTLGEVRAGRWLRPAGAGWHRRAFGL